MCPSSHLQVQAKNDRFLNKNGLARSMLKELFQPGLVAARHEPNISHSSQAKPNENQKT
jgi:hypothetical protein